MITVDDIKQYEDDGMFWVEGAQIVYAIEIFNTWELYILGESKRTQVK